MICEQVSHYIYKDCLCNSVTSFASWRRRPGWVSHRVKMACLLVGTNPLHESIVIFVSCTFRRKLPWNLNRNEMISFKEMHFQMSPVRWPPFCSSLNMLTLVQPWLHDQLFIYQNMMTSSNGNIFRVTCHFCGEFTGNSSVPGESPAQRPVTVSFDVFFDPHLNK